MGWRSTSACGARSLRPPWSRARIADWGTSTYFEVLWVTSGYLEALWANKSYFQVLWGTSACRVRRFCSPWYWARIADNRAQIYVIYIFIWYIQMWYIWYLCAVLVPGFWFETRREDLNIAWEEEEDYQLLKTKPHSSLVSQIIIITSCSLYQIHLLLWIHRWPFKEQTLMTNTNPSPWINNKLSSLYYKSLRNWTVMDGPEYNIDHEKVVILLDGNLWAPSVGYKQSLLYFFRIFLF